MESIIVVLFVVILVVFSVSFVWVYYRLTIPGRVRALVESRGYEFRSLVRVAYDVRWHETDDWVRYEVVVRNEKGVEQKVLVRAGGFSARFSGSKMRPPSYSQARPFPSSPMPLPSRGEMGSRH